MLAMREQVSAAPGGRPHCRTTLAMLVAGLLFGASSGFGLAQEASTGPGQDLQVAAQNPIANLISLPFQNNIFGGVGPYDDEQYVLNIEPGTPPRPLGHRRAPHSPSRLSRQPACPQAA